VTFSKLFGLNDDQIIKKSTWYGHFLGLILGVVMTISGPALVIYTHSDAYKKIIAFQQEQINYLVDLNKVLCDKNLPSIIDQYQRNINFIEKRFQKAGWYLLVIGLSFVMQFALFYKLRDKVLQQEAGRNEYGEKL